MEHSSHSHPLPHEHNHDGSPRCRSVRSSCVAPPYSAPASSPQASPFQALTPQSRRLQLRNARFNGPSLPVRCISPLFGLAASPVEAFSCPEHNENSTLKAEKRSWLVENLPTKSVNILQEIQNSARRKRTSPRPAFAMILQDQPSMDENRSPLDDDGTSWYNERSTECSPFVLRADSLATAPRKGPSDREKHPPVNSPLAKQTKEEADASSRLWSDHADQCRYIEDLESQLASAQTKIEALMSPKTKKNRSIRLRSLTAENRNLARENSEWVERAEEMVRDEKFRHQGLEVEMKSRLQALEEDIGVKDARMAELGWEIESMHARVRDAEGLEEANTKLEKRIDMLSTLLATSPNRPELRSATTSPNKFSAQFSPSKRTPRPVSMLPRVPSSPSGTHALLTSVSESTFWDSKSRSASIVETTDASALLKTYDEENPSPLSDKDMRTPDVAKWFNDSGSHYEGRHSASFSTQTVLSSSRPSSYMSTSSMGAPSWGVPTLPDGELKFNNRPRKMRKFPSGSNTLKPLILPVATSPTIQSWPASAPVYPSIEAVAKRDLSNGSPTDPTAAFLSRLEENSSFPALAVSSRRKSTVSAQEQTLKLLEGSHRNTSIGAKDVYGETCIVSDSCPETESRVPSSYGLWRSKPKNLQEELDKAEIGQGSFNALGISAPDARQDGLITLSGGSSSYEHPRHFQQRNTTPRAHPETIQTSHSATPPTLKTKTTLSNPTSDHPQSLFARITSLVAQTEQDHFVLARRILSNAWTLGSASMGGMAWWLLGPLHHHYRYRTLDVIGNADPHHMTDDSSKTGARNNVNWQHFSVEIRNGCVVDSGAFRDCGGAWAVLPQIDPPERQTANTVPPISPTNLRAQPHLFPCDECVEPSSRRSLRMWFQFSLTVVLAVGLAVKCGPGVLLADLSENERQHKATCQRGLSERVQHDQEQHQDQEQEQQLQPQKQKQQRRRYRRLQIQTDEDDPFRFGNSIGDKNEPLSIFAGNREGADSGYESIAFAEVLGPKDFEAG